MQKVPPMVKGFVIPRKTSAAQNDKSPAPAPLPPQQSKPTPTEMVRAATSSNAGKWKKAAPPSAPTATSGASPATHSQTPFSNIEVPPSKEAALFALALKMFNFEVDDSVRTGALIDYLLMLKFNSPDPRPKAVLRRQLEQIQVMGALESLVVRSDPDQEMVIRSYNQLCGAARAVVKRFPELCEEVRKEALIKKPLSPLAVLSPKFYKSLHNYLCDFASLDGFPMTSTLKDALVWQLLTRFGFKYDAITPTLRKAVADHVARRLN